jgi:hypothetical protein
MGTAVNVMLLTTLPPRCVYASRPPHMLFAEDVKDVCITAHHCSFMLSAAAAAAIFFCHAATPAVHCRPRPCGCCCLAPVVCSSRTTRHGVDALLKSTILGHSPLEYLRLRLARLAATSLFGKLNVRHHVCASKERSHERPACHSWYHLAYTMNGCNLIPFQLLDYDFLARAMSS